MKLILTVPLFIVIASCSQTLKNNASIPETVTISEPRSGTLEKIAYYYDGIFLPRKVEIEFELIERQVQFSGLVPKSIRTSDCSGIRINIGREAFSNFRGGFFRFSAYNNRLVSPNSCDIRQTVLYIVQKETPNDDRDSLLLTYVGRYSAQSGWQFSLSE